MDKLKPLFWTAEAQRRPFENSLSIIDGNKKKKVANWRPSSFYYFLGWLAML
jgi:hypothetical protein